MKYVTIPLTALRSHPNLNLKVTKDEELYKYYNMEIKEKFPTYYISFTTLDKIGINPNFGYNNPIGVYCYPLRYVYRNKRLNINFAGDRPFIQVLKLSVPKTKVLSNITYTKEKFTHDLGILQKIFSVYEKNLTNVNKKRMYDIISDYLTSEDADKITYISSNNKPVTFNDVLALGKMATKSLKKVLLKKSIYIPQIWCITQAMSALFSKDKYTIKWNTLLRKLGYDVVLDSGIGFIHMNEPSQAVFLVSQAYEHVDTIDNKKQPDFSLYEIDKLKNAIKPYKDGYRIVGNVNLKYKKTPKDLLVSNLTITGSLTIKDTQLKELPENLHIEKDLILDKTTIKSLPEKISIGRDLIINKTPISQLPDNLTINGNLYLYKTEIKRLPNNLTVKGNLDISGLLIKEMPKGLSVGGKINSNFLFKIGSNKYYLINNLPENSVIDKDLYITTPDVTHLPKGLRVNGDLTIGSIGTRTKITELPENLYVKGDADLSDSSIKEIGKNTKIDGSLFVVGSKIKHLPEGLVVGVTSNLMDSDVESILPDIKVGNLILGNSKVTKLPENLVINDTLLVEDSLLKELPDNLTVKGELNLDIQKPKITKLPHKLKVGVLRLNEDTTELPDDLQVSDTLYIPYNKIKIIPKGVHEISYLD